MVFSFFLKEKKEAPNWIMYHHLSPSPGSWPRHGTDSLVLIKCSWSLKGIESPCFLGTYIPACISSDVVIYHRVSCSAIQLCPIKIWYQQRQLKCSCTSPINSFSWLSYASLFCLLHHSIAPPSPVSLLKKMKIRKWPLCTWKDCFLLLCPAKGRTGEPDLSYSK